MWRRLAQGRKKAPAPGGVAGFPACRPRLGNPLPAGGLTLPLGSWSSLMPRRFYPSPGGSSGNGGTSPDLNRDAIWSVR